MNLHVKKGDAVMIIAGKDKGKSGVISKVDVKNGKVIVDGLNLVSKTKKAKTAQERNEIVKVPAALNASNVMLVCGSCGKVVRAANKTEEKNGKKVNIRVCKNCGASLEIERAAKAKSAAKKATKKKTTVKEAEVVEAVAEEAVVKAEAEVKKPAAKKTEAKKPAAKKPAAKAEGEKPAAKKPAAKKPEAAKVEKTDAE